MFLNLKEGFSEEAPSSNMDEELAKSLAQSFELDQDEAFARQLMLEEQRGIFTIIRNDEKDIHIIMNLHHVLNPQ